MITIKNKDKKLIITFTDDISTEEIERLESFIMDKIDSYRKVERENC